MSSKQFITTAALLHEYPYAHRFIVRMRERDPEYGCTLEQEYQIKHLNDAQLWQPCLQKHEHDGGCYSKATWEHVTRAYRKMMERP